MQPYLFRGILSDLLTYEALPGPRRTVHPGTHTSSGTTLGVLDKMPRRPRVCPLTLNNLNLNSQRCAQLHHVSTAYHYLPPAEYMNFCWPHLPGPQPPATWSQLYTPASAILQELTQRKCPLSPVILLAPPYLWDGVHSPPSTPQQT